MLGNIGQTKPIPTKGVHWAGLVLCLYSIVVLQKGLQRIMFLFLSCVCPSLLPTVVVRQTWHSLGHGHILSHNDKELSEKNKNKFSSFRCCWLLFSFVTINTTTHNRTSMCYQAASQLLNTARRRWWSGAVWVGIKKNSPQICVQMSNA